jgi:acyl carrier protein
VESDAQGRINAERGDEGGGRRMTDAKLTEHARLSIDQVINVLKSIVADDLNITLSAEQIDESALLEDDLGLDSVALVQMIAAIESRLNFEFLDADLRMNSFRTLRVLAQVIVNRMSCDNAG